MSYSAFQSHVKALIAKAGGKIKVRFYNDEEKGIYTAVCSDNCRIIGSSSCLRVKVTWGSGHAAFAQI